MEELVRGVASRHSGGKLGQAKSHIEATTGHMKKNISQLINTQTDREAIDQRTDDLRTSADMFSQRGRELERKL